MDQLPQSWPGWALTALLVIILANRLWAGPVGQALNSLLASQFEFVRKQKLAKEQTELKRYMAEESAQRREFQREIDRENALLSIVREFINSQGEEVDELQVKFEKLERRVEDGFLTIVVKVNQQADLTRALNITVAQLNDQIGQRLGVLEQNQAVMKDGIDKFYWILLGTQKHDAKRET